MRLRANIAALHASCHAQEQSPEPFYSTTVVSATIKVP